MRIGGMVWFAAGFAFCLLYLNDGIDSLLRLVGATVGAVVVFVLELGGLSAADGGASSEGMLAVFAVLALIGVTLLIGRSWAERARGFHDADEAFERRRKYRQ